MHKFLLFICLVALTLTGCSFTQKPAPVSDLRNQLAEARGYHKVQHGETLYFIAWRFGKDFRELAAINKLTTPYKLHYGQKIYLSGKTQYYNYQPKTTRKQKSKHTKISVKPATYYAPINKSVRSWQMPAKGKVINTYSALNKGINIAGTPGEPIVAAAAGQVVYAGAGLRGYGNLLIVKHNDMFLTAYAHNKKLLVKEGQSVAAGQKIATMGSTGANRVMLHFEIRKRGKPVNPRRYLRYPS
jgi:lipoprotein NlpD